MSGGPTACPYVVGFPEAGAFVPQCRAQGALMWLAPVSASPHAPSRAQVTLAFGPRSHAEGWRNGAGEFGQQQQLATWVSLTAGHAVHTASRGLRPNTLCIYAALPRSGARFGADFC
jgi:hypothetical protein